MIVDAIYKYLGGDLAKADDRFLDTATQAFRRSLTRNMTEDRQVQDEKRKHISASSPWYCTRRILYGLRGEDKGPLAPRSRLAFLMGDVLEATGVMLTRLAGVNVLSPNLDGNQESCVARFGEYEIPGHIDMVVKDGAGAEIPVDWKSMADYGYGEFEAATRDPSAKWWTEERWGYLSQLRVYMKAKGAPYGLFVGINKNTGHLCEMHVPPDPAWEEEMTQRVQYAKACEKIGGIPPRPSWAVSEIKAGENLRADGSKGPVEEIKHFRCSYCPWTEVCWEGFALVPLKSKPAWRKAISAEAVTTGK